ncbi:DUF2796 domain-containing protein [Porticoccus sp. W117]|uniref:ZrgA family zinc uptake protein n=1 Tax=Porticoccus sp. W117 TaxID=3054777 RepID=UPI00259965A5|nr:DUF2796 domain-containing protein [Porticoccus sp. W117]MDM3871332.1 DUF2796 domain-containing protein [Porticoccus sp. W117]
MTGKSALTLLMMALAANSANAGHEHSLDGHHGGGQHAHVHGHAHMSLAQDGNTLWVEMRVPAFDLLGFEREAKDDGERALINATVYQLRQSQTLVKLPEAANCELQKAAVESPILEQDHSGHSHESHGHKGHADIEVSQQFECQNPASLNAVEVALFNNYSRIERADIQWTLEGRQGSARATPAESQINLK